MPKPIRTDDLSERLTKLQLSIDLNHKALRRQQYINMLFGIVAIVLSFSVLAG